MQQYFSELELDTMIKLKLRTGHKPNKMMFYPWSFLKPWDYNSANLKIREKLFRRISLVGYYIRLHLPNNQVMAVTAGHQI